MDFKFPILYLFRAHYSFTINKLFCFSELRNFSIKNGTVAKGMRKKAVLVAIGYPPAIETMSLDSDQWTYWSSRFNKFIVYFRNGKVYKIVD